MSQDEVFGFGVPLVTAGNTKVGVNEDLTRKIWDHLLPLIDVGVVLGTTGWGRNILNADPEQARRLVMMGIQLGEKHRKPIVVGAGAEDPQNAEELVKFASERDVYGVLVTDPIHAASSWAQQYGEDPTNPSYIEAMADEFHTRIIDAIADGSKTKYMPYIFPQLTARNDLGRPAELGYPQPRELNMLLEHAESQGKVMFGGKLTHMDLTVAQLYALKCPKLTLQAGFDNKAKEFLGDPTLRFNGAIYGLGNLFPKFLRTHVYDCLKLRRMREKDPKFEQDATLEQLVQVTKQQNQVDAVFSFMWNTPGAFPRLIHGILGIGKPFHVPKVSEKKLHMLAAGMADAAPNLAEEMLEFNRNAPLAAVIASRLREGLSLDKPTAGPKTVHRTRKPPLIH